MPIGIGYIASYMLAHVDSDAIEVRLYDDSDIVQKGKERSLPKCFRMPAMD